MKYSLGISDFLEVISSLSHSIFFLYFFACSLKKSFLFLLAYLLHSALNLVYHSLSSLHFTSLLFSAICKAPPTTSLPSYISFSWEWFWSSSHGSDGKASVYNVGDLGSIPGWGRTPGEGNGNPLQGSCLEYSMN